MKIINNIPDDGRFSLENRLPTMVGHKKDLEQAVYELLLRRFNHPDLDFIKYVTISGLTYTWIFIKGIIEIYQPGSGHTDTYTEVEIDRCLGNKSLESVKNNLIKEIPTIEPQSTNKDYLFTKEGIYD